MKQLKNLQNVLTIVIFLSLIAYLFNFKVLFLISIIIGFIGLLVKELTEKIAIFWIYLTQLIGNINTIIILSIMFYLIVFPTALIRTIFQKDILQLKKPENSNFKEVKHNFSQKDFVNTW